MERHAELVHAFREYYFHLEAVILDAARRPTDSNVIQRIWDGLDEFSRIIIEVRSQIQSNALKHKLKRLESNQRFLNHRSFIPCKQI